MNSEALQFLGVVVTSAGIFGGVLLAQRQAGKKTSTDAAQGLSDTTQRLIDQLQEERGDIRDRLDKLEERERVRDDYVQLLRNHIRDQLPPPPPPWPEGLRNG